MRTVNNIILLFFGLLSISQAFSQDKVPVDSSKFEDCINIREISIPLNSETYRLKDGSSDAYGFNLVYYENWDEYTFWYRIKATENCTVKFSVAPSRSTDDYDFMLYQFKEENFCEAIVDGNVLPINSNRYKKEVSTTEKNKEVNRVYQQEIYVRKGEVYYISVLTLKGDDCGHILDFEACGQGIIINSVHKPCFLFTQPEIAERAESDEIYVEDYLIITGLARDNETGKPIDAELTFTDMVSLEKFTTTSTADGGYKIKLERARTYKFECKAFGYSDIGGTMEFMRPSVYEFFLLKIRAGQEFATNKIHFYPNTYAMRDDSEQEMSILLKYLKNNPEVEVEIQGHTAGDTPVKDKNPQYEGKGDEWNYTGSAKKLSKLRAEAVMEYLVEKGIDKKRLNTRGYGAEKMLIPNPINEEQRKLNMRVGFLVIKTSSEDNDYNYEYDPTNLDDYE